MRRIGAGFATSLAALALAATVGCGVEASDERAASQAAPIIDGTASGTDHDSVMFIMIKGKGACTGTLVAPNLVLTARHCVTETDAGALCKVDGTPYDGGRLYSNFAASDLLVCKGQLAVQLSGEASRADAKGKQIITESTSTYCDSDVAFILLDRAVSAPVAPIRLKEGAREGESITAVGWGLTEDGRTPSKRLEREGIRVEAVGPYTFDERTKIGLAKSEFLIGEGICSGDSGGPAFASTGAVVGVVSRGGNGEQASGAASCIGSNTIGIYTHLANKKALVEKAFKLAGFAPRDEGTPPGKVAGESCTENVDCSSNTCVSKVCRTPCTDDSACESGETCTTKGDLQICLPEPKQEKPAQEPGDDANAAAPSSTTTKTTQSGCSAAPVGARSSASLGALLLGVAVALRVRRRRR